MITGRGTRRRETHSLFNHGARIALEMCDHGDGCPGEETHHLFNHGTRIALEMCDHGEGHEEEGNSQPIQPRHQDRIRYV